MELNLIATALNSRDDYLMLEKLLAKGDLSDMGGVVYKAIQSYYQRDGDALYVDSNLLLQMIQQSHPNHADKFAELFNNIPQVSAGNVLSHLTDVRKQSVGLQISNALDLGNTADAQDLMNQYQDLCEMGIQQGEEEGATNEYQDADISIITEAFDPANIIPIYPSRLGEIFGGGALRGDHALFFAPPECGKTLLAINMACGCIANGYKVLYCGNEDPAQRMLMRFICRLSMMPQVEVIRDEQEALFRARERGYQNLVFVSMAPGSTDEVKAMCRKHQPDVCIVDQLPNLVLSGQKQPGKSELLEKLAYEMRMFYKAKNIFGISMAQASEESIGKLMLEIKDVFYSNIGVQGQVDIMVGIGMNHDYEAQSRRCLNIVKNKVNGKHTYLNITIVPLLSQAKAN